MSVRGQCLLDSYKKGKNNLNNGPWRRKGICGGFEILTVFFSQSKKRVCVCTMYFYARVVLQGGYNSYKNNKQKFQFITKRKTFV